MVEPITTHVADGIARITTQYKGQTAIEGLVSAHLAQFQELEDAINAYREARSVFIATGWLLEQIGIQVGAPRPLGMDDEEYRIYVLATIGKNVSGGEPEQIIQMFKILTDGRVRLTELFPAAIALHSTGSIPSGLESLVVDAMSDAVAGGVRIGEMTIASDLIAIEDRFAFAGGGPTRKGFGDVNNPGDGGKFANVLI